MVQGSLFTSETKSQESAILAHLQSGKAITPIDALNLYKCFRLGGRIYDLKKQGYKIETEMVHKNGKHFASYRLVSNEDPAT